MADTPEILSKSREYFRNFLAEHKQEIFNAVREYRTSPGSGYSPFYKSTEIIQHLRDIESNLDDNFRNLNIPGDFSSPKRLAETWKAFDEYLAKQDTLIKEVQDKIVETKKAENGDEFEHLLQSGMIFPVPFTGIASIHCQVKDVLEFILEMNEVKIFLEEKKPSEIKNVLKENHNAFDLAIITALNETEYEALLNLPVTIEQFNLEDDPTDYRKFRIGNTSVLIATDDTMGMAAATSLTTKLIAKFKPKYIIMSGIAGGVKDKEKNYGDILVARWSFNYESGKYKYNIEKQQSVFEPNPEHVEMANSFLSKINRLKLNRPLLNEIAQGFLVDEKNIKPNANLKVFIGPVASGSAVIADSKRIDKIRAGNRKLIGIDMETFGVMYAAKSFSNTQFTKAISIKSISDFADQRKSDKYRRYAAYTSAMFIYNFILTELQNP